MRFYRANGLLAGLIFSLPVLATGVTLERLRSDQAALAAAEHDYRTHASSLSSAEAADFVAYIERLRQRLAADCGSLRRAGVEPPADVSCPQQMMISPPSVQIDQRYERTQSEQTGVLDAELQQGLGDFDEKLLREQARVKAQAPRTSGNGARGMGGGAGGDGEGFEGGEGGKPGSTAAAASGETGADAEVATGGVEQPAGTAGGMGQPGSGQPASSQPADVPDGSDDDVVARQLREAAEKETDPVLKEKLWDEYRKYKQGTR